MASNEEILAGLAEIVNEETGLALQIGFGAGLVFGAQVVVLP
jgi:hypothetical protein